jgi:hypothetical protein
MRAVSPENYLLLSPLAAVRLGGTLENAKAGHFVTIPAGLTVALDGASSISGLIDVTCEGTRYAIFQVDLEERAEPLVGTSLAAHS